MLGNHANRLAPPIRRHSYGQADPDNDQQGRRERNLRTEFSLADRRSGPVTTADRKDRLALLEAALEKLPPDYREVILLSRIEKLSAKEIGERMNRSENAVHLLLGRALKSLAKVLKF